MHHRGSEKFNLKFYYLEVPELHNADNIPRSNPNCLRYKRAGIEQVKTRHEHEGPNIHKALPNALQFS